MFLARRSDGTVEPRTGEDAEVVEATIRNPPGPWTYSCRVEARGVPTWPLVVPTERLDISGDERGFMPAGTQHGRDNER